MPTRSPSHPGRARPSSVRSRRPPAPSAPSTPTVYRQRAFRPQGQRPTISEALEEALSSLDDGTTPPPPRLPPEPVRCPQRRSSSIGRIQPRPGSGSSPVRTLSPERAPPIPVAVPPQFGEQHTTWRDVPAAARVHSRAKPAPVISTVGNAFASPIHVPVAWDTPPVRPLPAPAPPEHTPGLYSMVPPLDVPREDDGRARLSWLTAQVFSDLDADRAHAREPETELPAVEPVSPSSVSARDKGLDFIEAVVAEAVRQPDPRPRPPPKRDFCPRVIRGELERIELARPSTSGIQVTPLDAHAWPTVPGLDLPRPPVTPPYVEPVAEPSIPNVQPWYAPPRGGRLPIGMPGPKAVLVSAFCVIFILGMALGASWQAHAVLPEEPRVFDCR